MSVKVLDKVLAICIPPLVPTADKMVLIVLADAANEKGRNAYPSVPYLCAVTGLSRRKVQGILAKYRSTPAKRNRLLYIEEPADPSRYFAATYAFNMPLLRRLAMRGEARIEQMREARRRARRASDVQRRGAQGAPLESHRGAHSVRGRGAPGAPLTVKGTVITTTGTSTSARDVIELFDQIVARFWPDAAPRAKHPGDETMAEHWLSAGLDLETIKLVFLNKLSRVAERGRQPPGTLIFLRDTMRDTVAELRHIRSQPMQSKVDGAGRYADKAEGA